MKAARILRFGPPGVITNDDLPQPEPAKEVMITVEYPPGASDPYIATTQMRLFISLRAQS